VRTDPSARLLQQCDAPTAAGLLERNDYLLIQLGRLGGTPSPDTPAAQHRSLS